jgi:hypothetical protein
MKKNKFIIFLLVFFLGFNLNSQAEMTAPTPSVVLAQLATATSFSSDVQLDQVSIDTINESTANVVDPEALKAEVELGAAEFGKKIDEAALAVLAGDADDEQVLMVLSTNPLAENPYDKRKDLEPTLGTYIYDSGMMTLTRNLNEGANTKYNENTDTIFETENGVVQQARVTVYIDFKRQVLWGDLETKITLNDKEQFNKTIVGSSATVTRGPINKQLSVVYEQDTTKITDAESFSKEGVFLPTKHDTTSLMLADGTAAPYLDAEKASDNVLDEADMRLYISHFGGEFPDTLSEDEANGGVLAGARIKVGNNAATGELTASLEAATADPTDANISNDDFVKTIIRYDQTVNVEAQIFEGDSTR